MKLWRPRFPRIRLPSAAEIEHTTGGLLLAGGFLMVARGLWLVYPPAMYIVGGAILIWWGLPRKGAAK